MDDKEIAALQDEDEWDFETAERQRAPRGRRAIVSVGFKPADFASVASAAEKRDLPVSQFIREAAIDRARGCATKIVVRQPRCISDVRVQKNLDAALLDALRGHRRPTALR